MIYHTRGEHADHYTTGVVALKYLQSLIYDKQLSVKSVVYFVNILWSFFLEL